MAQHRNRREYPAPVGSLGPTVAACALLFFLPFASQLEAQKIKIDYERTAEFSRYKTYAWVPGTPVFDPQLDAHITKTIMDELRRSGMTEAPVNAADLLVTYHAAIDTDLSVGTAVDPTFAATGGVPVSGHSVWETGGGGATHVTKGSLAIEILDRIANRPVWYGTAKHTVSDLPHERWDQIQKALDKLLGRFPPSPRK